MYITGNPLLNNCRHTMVNLAYTWDNEVGEQSGATSAILK